ncbi:hypothetical protein ACFWHW_12605 [Streptomyces pharetrae]|uniref:hypothetical protein n=1 Tax=Streptomyces pharetrae TaxID=291370 RepID=UPI0036525E3C
MLLDVPKLTHTTAAQEFAVSRAEEDNARLRTVGFAAPATAAARGLLLTAGGAVPPARGGRWRAEADGGS